MDWEDYHSRFANSKLTEEQFQAMTYQACSRVKRLCRPYILRKLWTAVASFVSMMILATGGTDNTATQVTALIMAGASVIAYIIGEGLTDSSNNKEQEDK